MLAHYLENAGLPTVVIALVRRHAEIIRPPRALFVPFELGRTLGEPCDMVGQRQVLHRALAMLAHVGPDPLLTDLPDPAPRTPPLWLPPIVPVPGSDAGALRQEFAAILPAYEQARLRRGRSTFGISGFDPGQALEILCDLFADPPPAGPRLSSEMVRFVIDDLKTLYLEAAAPGPDPVPSLMLGNWLWRQTVLGRVLVNLRQSFIDSGDTGRQRLGQGFLVPGLWVTELGL